MALFKPRDTQQKEVQYKQLIEDIKQSTNEVPSVVNDYYNIMLDMYAYNVAQECNYYGFMHTALTYYNKVLSSNTTKLIINSITNKVITTEVIEEVSNINQLSNTVMLYGRALMVLDSVDNTGSNATFRIIPPYKYYIDGDSLYIINKIADDKYTEEVRKQTPTGITVTLTTYHIDKRLYNPQYNIIRVDESKTYDTKLATYVEVFNVEDVSTIHNIRGNVLMSDYNITQIYKELKTTKTVKHMDAEYIPSHIQDADAVELYESPITTDGNKHAFFKIEQPMFRASQYWESYYNTLTNISIQLGINNNIIGFDKGYKTIAQTDTEDDRTGETINSYKQNLQTQLFDFLAQYNIAVDFGIYIKQSKEARLLITKTATMTVLQKMMYENPHITDKEQLYKDSLIYKLENGIMMTTEEEQDAQRMNIIGVGNAY